jgi:hypothetical protein
MAADIGVARGPRKGSTTKTTEYFGHCVQSRKELDPAITG